MICRFRRTSRIFSLRLRVSSKIDVCSAFNSAVASTTSCLLLVPERNLQLLLPVFAPTLTKAQEKSLWDKSTKVRGGKKIQPFDLVAGRRLRRHFEIRRNVPRFHRKKITPGNVNLKKSGRREEKKKCFFSLTCSFVQVPGRLSSPCLP